MRKSYVMHLVTRRAVIEREMAGTTFNVAGTRVGVQVLPAGATLPLPYALQRSAYPVMTAQK